MPESSEKSSSESETNPNSLSDPYMFQIHRAGENCYSSYWATLPKLFSTKSQVWLLLLWLWLAKELCEAWAWSRCEKLYRKILDAPQRLKVNEVKPGAIVLWTLAHSYWVSALLLLLALPLWFSKFCEILNKVTRRQADSPFVNQIPILLTFSFLENYNSRDIFATDVLNSYKNWEG